MEPASAPGEVRLRADGRDAGTSDSTTGAALRRLDDVRPGLVPCSQLFGSRAELPVDFLINAMGSGTIDGVLTPFNLTNQIDTCPSVSPLVRLQARQGGLVTNQKSEPLQLSDLMRHVAQQLDGERDHSALAGDLARHLQSNAIGMEPELLLLDRAATPSHLADTCVRYFRDQALLIPGGHHGDGVREWTRAR